MGSCLSTRNERGGRNGKNDVEPKDAAGQVEDSEESAVVKEVLTETPKPSSATREQQHEDFIEKTKPVKTPVKASEKERAAAVAAEAYEIYDVKGEENEKARERREDSEDSATPTKKFQKKQHSMSGDFTYNSEHQKLQANRNMTSSPSRVRKPGQGSSLGRSFSSAENFGSLRRDTGGSRRRPGSPAATRANGVTRTSSLGRAPSQGCVDYDGAEWRAERVNEEATRGKESLENPLVSLECFIFL